MKKFGQGIKVHNTVRHSSVDGTDCCIQELRPFSPAWFSHKFKGPGVGYEIAVSLEGEIVLVNGPYPCEFYPDLKMFKRKLSHHLGQPEQIIADSGHNHPRCVNEAALLSPWKYLHKKNRARHACMFKMGMYRGFLSPSSKHRHGFVPGHLASNSITTVVDTEYAHQYLAPTYLCLDGMQYSFKSLLQQFARNSKPLTPPPSYCASGRLLPTQEASAMQVCLSGFSAWENLQGTVERLPFKDLQTSQHKTRLTVRSLHWSKKRLVGLVAVPISSSP